MQTADLIFVSVSGLMFDIYNILSYCNRVSVKMASENSSEDEFETLQGPVRPYLFEQTAKPAAEWIKLPQRHANLVLGSFENVNFKFVFLRVQTLQ